MTQAIKTISNAFKPHQNLDLQKTSFEPLEPFKSPPQEPRILRIKQVLAIYPVGRSTLYSMISKRIFPASISLGGARSVGWRSQDVYAFIANLEAK